MGRRFNNLDAAEAIGRNGWDSHFCTWDPPESGNARVAHGATARGARLQTPATLLSYYSGHLDRFFRNAGGIMRLPSYEQADVLHFHIVHEHWLSTVDWVRLASGKPVVWTWHDPYMITGHCVHPLGCTGFETGCRQCPHLDYYLPVRRDVAASNLERKIEAVRKISPLVIVASEYMAGLVKRSLHADLRVKVIPFGVEWAGSLDRAAARAQLGISESTMVIGFRAAESIYKGLPLVKDALHRVAAVHGDSDIAVIAFEDKGALDGIPANWRVIETGWIADASIGGYYAAIDFFLMPSRAEAFGMMAVEALAAGCVPIVTYGTALPELVNAPVHGVVVEHSGSALAEGLLTCLRELHTWRLGADARREYGRRTFGMKRFAARLAATYDEEYAYHADQRRSSRR